MSKHRWKGIIMWACPGMSAPLFFPQCSLSALACISLNLLNHFHTAHISGSWVVKITPYAKQNVTCGPAPCWAPSDEDKCRTENRLSVNSVHIAFKLSFIWPRRAVCPSHTFTFTHAHTHKHNTNQCDLNPPGIGSIRPCAYEKIIIWWYEDTALGGWVATVMLPLLHENASAANCVPKP